MTILLYWRILRLNLRARFFLLIWNLSIDEQFRLAHFAFSTRDDFSIWLSLIWLRALHSISLHISVQCVLLFNVLLLRWTLSAHTARASSVQNIFRFLRVTIIMWLLNLLKHIQGALFANRVRFIVTLVLLVLFYWSCRCKELCNFLALMLLDWPLLRLLTRVICSLCVFLSFVHSVSASKGNLVNF